MPIEPYIIPEPKRGLIIVDASSLLKLAQGVDAGHDAKKYGRQGLWSDPLIALSQAGFEVAIPEAVVMEVERTLIDGTVPPKGTVPIKIAEEGKAFLREIRSGRWEHIHIIPHTPEGTSIADEYLRRLHHVMAVGTESDQRRALGKERRDMGDEGACDIVRALPAEWKAPIYYLAEDKQAQAYMHLIATNVCRLTANGFLNAVKDLDIDDAIGIDMRQVGILSLGGRLTDKVRVRINKHRTGRRSSSDTIVDTSFPVGFDNDYPFLQALKDAREVILANHHEGNLEPYNRYEAYKPAASSLPTDQLWRRKAPPQASLTPEEEAFFAEAGDPYAGFKDLDSEQSQENAHYWQDRTQDEDTGRER